MRKIIIAAVAAIAFVALSIPAFGYKVTWDGPKYKEIPIKLQIDCYIQIDWQDSAIVFNDGTSVDPETGTYDFWSDQLEGKVYALCPDGDTKHSPDPWAGDHWYATNGLYYESADGAVLYINSNNDLTMTVHVNGDLAGTENDSNNKIPTWFTLCLAPFTINSIAVDDGYRSAKGGVNPFTDKIGGYADGSDAGGVMTVGAGNPIFPNQNAFPCAPASRDWTLDLDAQSEGTMKFLCRIHRHGMADPGDLYKTFIDVSFATP